LLKLKGVLKLQAKKRKLRKQPNWAVAEGRVSPHVEGRTLLEKLIVPELGMKFRKIVTAFTKTQHMSLS